MRAEINSSLHQHALLPTMMSMQGASQAMRELADEHEDESSAPCDELCVSPGELQSLSAQALLTQENERYRIAKDLHDGLGQSLTMISLGLGECAMLLENNSHCEAEESLQKMRLKVRDAFAELHRVVMDLRPSMLDDLGLLPTIAWFFREFESSATGISVDKQLLIAESAIPASLKIAIYRILQEAVSNILKHAKADHIRVSIVKECDALQLSIEDNGQGFEPILRNNNCFQCKGFGLLSMKDRANVSGGIFRIDSAAGQGTRIHVSWTCG